MKPIVSLCLVLALAVFVFPAIADEPEEVATPAPVGCEEVTCEAVRRAPLTGLRDRLAARKACKKACEPELVCEPEPTCEVTKCRPQRVRSAINKARSVQLRGKRCC